MASGASVPSGARIDVRAHRAQRLDDPAHGPLHEALVTGEHREERPAGEQPGRRCASWCRSCRSRARARVRPVRRRPRPSTVIAEPAAVMSTPRSRSSEARPRDVVAPGQADRARAPGGHRREQQRAVRDPLVAGDAQPSPQRRRSRRSRARSGMLTTATPAPRGSRARRAPPRTRRRRSTRRARARRFDPRASARSRGRRR